MRIVRSFYPVLFLLIYSVSNAQGVTAMMAYDSATTYRDVADSLWDTEKPTKENLGKALVILQKGLDYLDEPAIQDLAQGNQYLNTGASIS